MNEPQHRPSKWPDVADILGAVGVGLLSYGTWLIYRPAAFIVGGACLIVIAVGAAITKARR